MVGQYDVLEGGVESWIADNGATTHMAPDPDHVYNERPPYQENAVIFIADGTEPVVEYVGSVNLIFHSTEDVRETVESVSFVPSLKVNLLSLHTIQPKEAITLDATGAY